MFDADASFTSDTDKFKGLTKALKELQQNTIFVGIPQEKGARESETITNAELGFIMAQGVRKREMIKAMQPDINRGTGYTAALQAYIHENGSPMWNAPPRPFIQPALEANKQLIEDGMKEIANAALSHDQQAYNSATAKLGQEAVTVVQEWFTNPNNHWAPNSQRTIKVKKSSNPLIDTGQLRKAITYVIRR